METERFTYTYAHVRTHYGDEAVTTLKQIKRTQININKITTTIAFLKKCQQHGVIPKFISNQRRSLIKLNNFNKIIDKSFELKLTKFEDDLLHLHIKNKYIENRNLTSKKRIQVQKIFSLMPPHIYREFERKFKNNQKVHIKKLTNKHENKFHELKAKCLAEMNLKIQGKYFINKTNVDIPSDVRLTLSLGSKFGIPTKTKELPLFNFISDIESSSQGINVESQREEFRKRVSNSLIHNFPKYKNTRKERMLIALRDTTKKFLRRNPELYIINADKGNVTVALTSSTYEEKMNNIVNDNSTYRAMRIDPTSSIQNKVNELTRNLHKDKHIDDATRKMLTSYTSIPPKMYGVPKIHKEDMPMRPIVSTRGSPTYQLSKFLANIINRALRSDKYNVNNSRHFKDRVSDISIEDNEIMVSFDVTSLFTNIPINLVIEIIKKRYNVITEHTSIPKNKFLEMLRICCQDSNFFKYKGKIYKQTFGLPMGSPLSPILADLVMDALLDATTEQLEVSPKIMVKYVDDLFAIVKRENLQRTLDTLNAYHRRLQFTVEVEQRGSLPFLDVLVIRRDNHIYTNWYQKPMASGRILNYNSAHPRKQILNVAKNFIDRVWYLSHHSFREQNRCRIKQILKNNSFPNNIIVGMLRMAGNTIPQEANRDQQSTKYRRVTYIPRLTESLQRAMRQHDGEISIAPKVNRTLRDVYTNTKDRTPLMDEAGVVYEIKCGGNEEDPCNKIYIGMTGQMLKNRINNHKSDLKHCLSNKTALANHCNSMRHTPRWEDTRIICKEKNYTRRTTLEALHIYAARNTMNKKTDTDSVNTLYRTLIEKHKSL